MVIHRQQAPPGRHRNQGNQRPRTKISRIDRMANVAVHSTSHDFSLEISANRHRTSCKPQNRRELEVEARLSVPQSL
jgi:hypothetical protein